MFELAKASLAEDRANAPRELHRAAEPVRAQQPAPGPHRAPESAPQPTRFHQPELHREAPPPAVEQQFHNAVDPAPAAPAPSRAEQTRREMAEWRKRNEGRDLGREI